jgi:hypothetical protein
MNMCLPSALILMVAAGMARADPPAQPPPADLCKVPNNTIVAANTRGRPLPLLKGDPAHPQLACQVPWSKLSPDDRPLPVAGCFAGKLLQIPNDSACGPDTGRLWVEHRWVVTQADSVPTARSQAVCQHLNTSTNAATREFHPECLPQEAAGAKPATAKQIPSGVPDAGAPPATPAPR